ncbi:hypothetical protein [Streptomyces sp. NPDC058989]|uniref:hypothetical protein n=1 Tax=Streptomyces sp. NPDC058989 TaxID=3346686 RepID=UPI0036B74C15
MTDATDNARLLPPPTPEGKRCLVVGDGTGYVSRMADNLEETQLGLAAELIDESRRILGGRRWTPGEIHLLAVELTDALAQVHRVAKSRDPRRT